MKQLILMRHAKSAWNTDASSDAARPLSKRGRRDAPRMGAWLHRNNYIPDHLLSSPSLRTRQTVELLRKELKIRKTCISWVNELYHPSPAEMLSLVKSAQQDWNSLMLVSHNPGLEELLLHLCKDSPGPGKTGKLFPTAAVAVLSCDSNDWLIDRGSYMLESLGRPRELEH